MNSSINAVAKRYRYTGKERDEESGLNYHGARYYIAWLCRWAAVDPLESRYAGWSSYCYLKCNPLNDIDSTGMGGDDDKSVGVLAPAPPKDWQSEIKGYHQTFELPNFIVTGTRSLLGSFADRELLSNGYSNSSVDNGIPNARLENLDLVGAQYRAFLKSHYEGLGPGPTEFVDTYTEKNASQKLKNWLSQQSILSPFAWLLGMSAPPPSAAQDLAKPLTYLAPVVGLPKAISEAGLGVASGNPTTSDYVNLGLSTLPILKNLIKVERSLTPVVNEILNETDDIISVFHKGELQGGIISSNRSLSTGLERSSVEALNRSGKVWEFRIPRIEFMKWKYEGLTETLIDLDKATGALNQEIRFSPRLANELNKYLIKK